MMHRMRMRRSSSTNGDSGIGSSAARACREMNSSNSGSGSGSGPEEVGWELRPGGMVVQTRDPSLDNDTATPKITLRVTYGSSMHYVSISKRATFGELKKLLSAETGLDPQDQKVLFKRKERDAKEFLDLVGVKERSKIVLMEDALSREKRYLEMRKNAKAEKASRIIAEVSLEVDKLASQVTALEGLINKGKRVAENDLTQLVEHLMRHLVILDGLAADGDAKLQKRMQIKRIQKHVETLDVLKVRNATAQNRPTTQNHPTSQNHHPSSQTRSVRSPVVVTTKWETFDS